MIIFPSKAMAHKLSLIVKGRREAIHMSQVELAKGICTQTTISTLENKGCFTSWSIVPEIFERLRLDLNDLENDCNYRYGENNLNRVEKNLLTHNFKRARERLNKIKFENLDTKNLIARYRVADAYLSLFIDQNQDEAIGQFQLVIDKYQTGDNQIIIGWAYLGMAIAYHQVNLKTQTNYYLNFAIKSLHLCFKKKNKSKDFQPIIRYALSLVVMINKSGNSQACLNELKIIIKKLKNCHSFYCLRDFYRLAGSCCNKLDQKEKADEYYFLANQLQNLYS